jgi:hypothetical protein
MVVKRTTATSLRNQSTRTRISKEHHQRLQGKPAPNAKTDSTKTNTSIDAGAINISAWEVPEYRLCAN